MVARHVPLSERIPLWVYATAGLLIAAILYTGFHLRLGGYADRLGPLVAALPPAPPVDIVRSGATSAAALPSRQVTTIGPALAECLRAAGLRADGVSEDFQKVRVRLPSAGLFNSGRADLNASYQPLLGCLGRALASEPGRVLVVGHTDSVPIRSFALRFTQANGEQWRTGMNAMPVFAVATPQAFLEQTLASRPDPATGKPDPAKVAAFFAAHPETAAFRAWVKTARPSASYATETYHGLNAFYLVDARGMRQAVRWRVVPEAADEPAPIAGTAVDLAADLERWLAAGPLRWRLLVTLADPGDPTDDATKAWPASRTTIDTGTVIVRSTQAEESGACRDINFDPTVLPAGIEISDDPLLPARSAAYADSYLRRSGEQARRRAAAQEAAP